MKKTFYLFSFILLFCFCQLSAAEDVEYHFREGFAKSVPTGWVRNCTGTSSTVRKTNPAEAFAGDNAAKFDATYNGADKYLETPEYSNAGTLSFYISKNADNTLMDLSVLKIVDGVSTVIKSVDAFAAAKRDPNNQYYEWTKVSIDVNETAKVKFRFYATVRDGNSAWFAIDDIELTKLNGNVEPPKEALDKIITDFSDRTVWGDPLAKAPSSGEYTSSGTNGFSLENAVLVSGSMSCPSGEKHVNRIYLDKLSKGGAFVLPAVKNVGEIEIHANAGTAGNEFKLEEELNGSWSLIGSYKAKKTPDSIHVIPLNRNIETKLRVANNSSGAVVIYKVVTRTLKETQELNITAANPSEGNTCYYNLTKSIELTFNKEVGLGTGSISLNDTQIPVSECVIDGKTVSVPVALEGTPSGKSYAVVVPQGAFVDKSDANNKSNEKAFTFQTYKTVSYPSNYSSRIDVLYSTADVNQNRMDIYYPTTSEKPVPVVINIHGGGWNHGEKESQTGYNVYFNMGFAVANIEYRMTPQALAPAAIEDARCAMKYLLAHASELNIDPMKIVFQGGSAGGHLALTAGYLQNDEKFDTGCNPYTGDYKIIAVIDKYGPSHLEEFMFYTSLANWLGDKKDDKEFVESISPALMVNANTPPTYIIHGDADPTVPYKQSEILRDSLRANSVKHVFTTVPDGLHGGFPAEYNTRMNSEITVFLTEILEAYNSIEPNSEEKKISLVFRDDVLSVNCEDDCVTEIFDILGRKLISSKEKQINIPQYITDVFVARVTANESVCVRKILK
ncbi:alpha/beta hydrolase [Dysgonomonas sp. 520]|uniref:alpha/beta hydrolase n=1 Tax=Dysgonomonas sp. 520 TaxID=2302931 RepID=UPI0013D83E47|nr:alpha/beta hydrolase [Dysgonomonas sp. 520]NDW09652.1 alpha/beta hydrolase [Dysgonomonas sp. 520]